ncbi:MAG: hypothetical protein LBF01_00970, partial [Bacteroidales bacterium]|nr:hypothetical protein [Bacteroidales bacterium]
MTIGIIQPNIISDEIEKNLQHCEELMKSLMGVANAHSCVQIFLLPEMFATGFPATKEQAEPPLLADGDNQYAKIQLWMKCVARELNAVVAGSVAVRENEVAAETTTVAGTIATTVAEEETIVAVEEATTAVAEETTTEAKATEETAITGTTSTIAAEANKAIYNRLIWMRPTGEYFTYDKKHLFGAEKEAYQQGDQIITIQEQGWNFRLNICYDLRFPVWCKNRRLYG